MHFHAKPLRFLYLQSFKNDMSLSFRFTTMHCFMLKREKSLGAVSSIGFFFLQGYHQNIERNIDFAAFIPYNRQQHRKPAFCHQLASGIRLSDS